MAAGPASRLGSTEPGDKTGPRPSPALALARSYLRTFVRSYLRTFVPSYFCTFVPSYMYTERVRVSVCGGSS